MEELCTNEIIKNSEFEFRFFIILQKRKNELEGDNLDCLNGLEFKFLYCLKHWKKKDMKKVIKTLKGFMFLKQLDKRGNRMNE